VRGAKRDLLHVARRDIGIEPDSHRRYPAPRWRSTRYRSAKGAVTREIGSVTRNALSEAPFRKRQVGGDERYQSRPD